MREAAQVFSKGPDATEVLPVNGREATEALVASTVSLIAAACEASILQKKPRQGRYSVYWWMQEIANLLRIHLKLRLEAQVPGTEQKQI